MRVQTRVDSLWPSAPCVLTQTENFIFLSLSLYIALYIVGHNKGGSAPYYLSWSLFPLPHWSASAAATAGWLEPRANPGARVSSDSFKLFDIFSPLLYWWRYTRTTKSIITTLNKGGREKRPPSRKMCLFIGEKKKRFLKMGKKRRKLFYFIWCACADLTLCSCLHPPPSYAYYKYLYNTGVRTRPHALIGSAFVEYKANKKREKKEKGWKNKKGWLCLGKARAGILTYRKG